MFSALRPTADIVSEAVRIRGIAAFHNRSLRESEMSPPQLSRLRIQPHLRATAGQHFNQSIEIILTFVERFHENPFVLSVCPDVVADEEILDRDGLGIQWLLKNHRDLIDAVLIVVALG
jgi:hypothetical protein